MVAGEKTLSWFAIPVQNTTKLLDDWPQPDTFHSRPDPVGRLVAADGSDKRT
jgi:hypothetical protein